MVILRPMSVPAPQSTAKLTQLPASASDDSICAATNRGNKRKRKARYVQQGRLDQAGGSRSYRRVRPIPKRAQVRSVTDETDEVAED